MPARAAGHPIKFGSPVEVFAGEDVLVVFILAYFPSWYSVGVRHSCAFGPFIVFVVVIESGTFLFGYVAANG